MHNHLSASPLADSDQICSVGIRLHGGVLARLGNVYAPAQWMDLPGIWLAAGDFNTNLAEETPVQGRFSFPDTGTWRVSAHHDWRNPIPGRAESLGAEVLSQHAPVLCDVPCANALADRIAWWITVTLAWTPFLVSCGAT